MKILLTGKWETKEVYLDDVQIFPDESLRIKNCSPDGFNWGYGGSGPAQLALAILLKLYGNKIALTTVREFAQNVISKLPQSDFEQVIELNYGDKKDAKI